MRLTIKLCLSLLCMLHTTLPLSKDITSFLTSHHNQIEAFEQNLPFFTACSLLIMHQQNRCKAIKKNALVASMIAYLSCSCLLDYITNQYNKDLQKQFHQSIRMYKNITTMYSFVITIYNHALLYAQEKDETILTIFSHHDTSIIKLIKKLEPYKELKKKLEELLSALHKLVQVVSTSTFEDKKECDALLKKVSFFMEEYTKYHIEILQELQHSLEKISQQFYHDFEIENV